MFRLEVLHVGVQIWLMCIQLHHYLCKFSLYGTWTSDLSQTEVEQCVAKTNSTRLQLYERAFFPKTSTVATHFTQIGLKSRCDERNCGNSDNIFASSSATFCFGKGGLSLQLITVHNLTASQLARSSILSTNCTWNAGKYTPLTYMYSSTTLTASSSDPSE